MPHPFWTRKKIAALVLSSVAYFGLWEVTGRLGVPTVRDDAVADHSITTFLGRALTASCEATAMAPFVVKVRCKRPQVASRGSIVTVQYLLWPGKWRREICRSTVLVP